MPESRPDGSTATTTAAATSAPGIAQRRAKRSSTAQVRTIGAAESGASAAKRTGARQTLRSTPASIALASGPGIAAISRPSGRHRPVSASSAPRDDEGADRGGPAALHGAGGDEQRGARRRPRDRDRDPLAQREPDDQHAHPDRQRQQAGGGLGAGGADGGQPRDHDRERAAPGHDRGDDPRDDEMRTRLGSGCSRGAAAAAPSGNAASGAAPSGSVGRRAQDGVEQAREARVEVLAAQ